MLSNGAFPPFPAPGSLVQCPSPPEAERGWAPILEVQIQQESPQPRPSSAQVPAGAAATQHPFLCGEAGKEGMQEGFRERDPLGRLEFQHPPHQVEELRVLQRVVQHVGLHEKGGQRGGCSTLVGQGPSPRPWVSDAWHPTQHPSAAPTSINFDCRGELWGSAKASSYGKVPS